MQSVVGGQGFQKNFKMIKKHAGFCFTKSCMRSSVVRPYRSQWVQIMYEGDFLFSYIYLYEMLSNISLTWIKVTKSQEVFSVLSHLEKNE